MTGSWTSTLVGQHEPHWLKRTWKIFQHALTGSRTSTLTSQHKPHWLRRTNESLSVTPYLNWELKPHSLLALDYCCTLAHNPSVLNSQRPKQPSSCSTSCREVLQSGVEVYLSPSATALTTFKGAQVHSLYFLLEGFYTTHLIQRPMLPTRKCRAKIQQVIGPCKDLLTIVKRRKLQWYGNVSRSSGLAKTILQGTVKRGRRQGRQRESWEHNIRELTGLEFAKSQRAVENREKWRKLVAK